VFVGVWDIVGVFVGVWDIVGVFVGVIVGVGVGVGETSIGHSTITLQTVSSIGA
jgi:hypothetical protein